MVEGSRQVCGCVIGVLGLLLFMLIGLIVIMSLVSSETCGNGGVVEKGMCELSKGMRILICSVFMFLLISFVLLALEVMWNHE